MDTVTSTIVGILVGGIITWLVSMIYYHKAGEDLVREAEKLRESGERLRQGIRVIARALEAGKLAEVNWGPEGDPLGLVYRASAGNVLNIQHTIEGEGTYEPPPPGDTGPDEPVRSPIGMSSRADAMVVRAAENRQPGAGPGDEPPVETPDDRG